jgi:hypothetical protein
LRVAPGSDLNDQNQRVYCTPAIQGVSTSPHMSKSMSRRACSLAVGCGVSRRPSALLLAALFLSPITQASLKRWMDDLGSHVPTPEPMLQQLLLLLPVTAGQRDGYDPLGTDHWVLVVKAEHARILIPHDAASEQGDNAQQFLQRWQDHGLKVTAAFSDDSPSFTAAIKAVCPAARFQTDHVPTVKHGWGHLTKALFSSRRQVTARGDAQQEEACLAWAQQFWTWRGSLLTKPSNFSAKAQQALAALASEDAGFVHSFRQLLRPVVHLFAHTHSAAHAQLRLQQLRQDIHALADHQLQKMPPGLDDHWEQAMRYLRKKGLGKPRRGANSASGMRRLRRLEKNHDGIRSAATRQHYLQIDQAMKYLSGDVADFIEKGPQRVEFPGV